VATDVTLCTELRLVVCGLSSSSFTLARSDFRLLEPYNKHLAGKQFAADVNVRQVVTCLKRLTIQKRRNSKRISKNGYIAYIVKWRSGDKNLKKIIFLLSSNTENPIFIAEMRCVLYEVRTHYFYTWACLFIVSGY
jgi:hypothetical protein